MSQAVPALISDQDDILSTGEGLLLISALSAIVVSLLTFALF